MFCSIIIPTIGRATLNRAVTSVINQDFATAPWELFVVNDSGTSLPPAGWQQQPGVRVLSTHRRERCVARNAGAAVARGRYLHFLDDDDWLLPGALEAWWQLSHAAPQAGWLCGGLRVTGSRSETLAEAEIGLQGNCLAQVVGGAWVPIQASLIRSDAFYAAGGYDPAILGTEDQDLCRRIAAMADMATTRVTVACLYRGDDWHATTSTDYLRAAEDTRRSRDRVAHMPGALRRMLASAASAYWQGRLFRVFAALTLWHLRRRRLFRALSRAWQAKLVFLLAGPYLFQPDFWRAARADHVPGSLHFIVQRLERARGGGRPDGSAPAG